MVDVGPDADPAVSADVYAAAQAGIRADVDVVFKRAIVLDRAARVQDDAVAYLRSCIDNGPGQYGASGAQAGIAADGGPGVDDAGRGGAGLEQALLQRSAQPVVSDAHDDAVVLVQALQQQCHVAAQGPGPVARAQAGPGVVIEFHSLPAAGLRRVGNDAAMAAGTHDGQVLHRSSPMNSRIVASP